MKSETWEYCTNRDINFCTNPVHPKRQCWRSRRRRIHSLHWTNKDSHSRFLHSRDPQCCWLLLRRGRSPRSLPMHWVGIEWRVRQRPWPFRYKFRHLRHNPPKNKRELAPPHAGARVQAKLHHLHKPIWQIRGKLHSCFLNWGVGAELRIGSSHIPNWRRRERGLRIDWRSKMRASRSFWRNFRSDPMQPSRIWGERLLGAQLAEACRGRWWARNSPTRDRRGRIQLCEYPEQLVTHFI